MLVIGGRYHVAGRRMKPEPSRKHHGFTLVEVMVTVIVLAILTAVALPAFRSFISAQRIKNTSFDMMAMLTLARSEALKRNGQVTATPTNNDWAQGWTVTAANGTVISRQNPIPGITITCLQGSPLTAVACASLSYDAAGRCANAQSIEISSAGTTASNTRCLSIDLSGRPGSRKGVCS